MCFSSMPYRAGKSTLFNILAGITQPSSGNAYINGFCLRSEMSRIRESLGVCPQHDVLWPDLTVREHLQLYARLKAIKGTCVPEVSRLYLASPNCECKSGGSLESALCTSLLCTAGTCCMSEFSFLGPPYLLVSFFQPEQHVDDCMFT